MAAHIQYCCAYENTTRGLPLGAKKAGSVGRWSPRETRRPRQRSGKQRKKKSTSTKTYGKKRPKGKCTNTLHTHVRKRAGQWGLFTMRPFFIFFFISFFPCSLWGERRSPLCARPRATRRAPLAEAVGSHALTDHMWPAPAGKMREKKRTQHAHGRRARTRWAARNSIGCWCPRRACRRAAGPPQAPLSAR